MNTSPKSDPARVLAPLLLACAVLLWSGNFIAGRALGGSVPAVGLNFYRWSLALLILAPVALTEIRRRRRIILGAWRYLLALGLTGVAGFHILVYKALENTTATNALLVLSTAPAAIMLLSRLALGEPIGPRQWLGIGVSFAGAVVLICHGDLEALEGLGLGRGELWMLAAVPVWSSYSVLLKRRPPSLPERSTLAVSTAFGLLWMTPLVVLYPGVLDVAWTPAIAGGVAYIGAGASVVAFLCWNRGVALVGPARAGVFINLMPVSGALLASLILGEALRPYHAAGAALVFTGILLTQLGARRERMAIEPARASRRGNAGEVLRP
ncbi:MAG: DMT family transporter [Arenicellales bacterium]